MNTPSEFTDALARLDAEIAATEAKLADLRLKRTGAEAFLVYMNLPDRPARPASATQQAAEEPARPRRSPSSSGQADAILSLFQPDILITVDDALAEVRRQGYELTREQTRNALQYLVRTGRIESVKRGVWRLRNSEGPAGAGPSVSNTPTDQEGGVSHETAPETSSQAEHQHHAQLGASITEVAS
jgi:hypothetical protein